MSQREFCPRRTLSDESQDAFLSRSRSTKVSPVSSTLFIYIYMIS
jgi:hypothetical protein